MRVIAFAAAAMLAATSAAAAPASVQVSIGPKLQEKAVEKYGVREIDRLAQDLQRRVERSLDRSGALADTDIRLVLVDVQPNRPTMKQMSDRIGLSFTSFGIGGARIEGQAVSADGQVRPLSYAWYESDIRQVTGYTTWHDAEWTFDRFARRLARGEELASR
jgi:hypothetical protein